MNNKISAFFAVIVIFVIGGIITFLFIQGANQDGTDRDVKTKNMKNISKTNGTDNANDLNIGRAEEYKSKICTQEAKQCPDGSYVSRTGPDCEFALCPSEDVQMANPASVYCEKNGGKSEIRTENGERQTGYCKFSDGTECEEWKYFKGECKMEE